jgi:hypothetical protein
MLTFQGKDLHSQYLTKLQTFIKMLNGSEQLPFLDFIFKIDLSLETQLYQRVFKVR